LKIQLKIFTKPSLDLTIAPKNQVSKFGPTLSHIPFLNMNRKKYKIGCKFKIFAWFILFIASTIHPCNKDKNSGHTKTLPNLSNKAFNKDKPLKNKAS
jgi:hypothetical protein